MKTKPTTHARRWLKIKGVASYRDEHGDRVEGLVPFSASTVWRLLAQGKFLQPYRFDGGTFWDLDELQAILQSKRGAK